MQYLTISAALLSSALLSSAAPTTVNPLERRACEVAYPRAIGFPINFDIHQDAGRANSKPGFINFNNIPEGSYGCQLEVNFPADYPITSSGSSAVNVITTSSGQDTLFGTVTLQSSPIAPTKFVINSAQCASLMSYRIEIASDTEAGKVAFLEIQDAGFMMTYNC